MLTTFSMSEVIAKLPRRSRQVYEVLAQTTEGMTMGEVFEYLKVTEPGSMLGFNENLTSRANDLERMGLIVRGSKRVCGLSGVKATVWRQKIHTDRPTRPGRRIGKTKALVDVLDAAREHLTNPTETSYLALKVLVEAADRVLS
jgi:hypothetical protein